MYFFFVYLSCMCWWLLSIKGRSSITSRSDRQTECRQNGSTLKSIALTNQTRPDQPSQETSQPTPPLSICYPSPDNQISVKIHSALELTRRRSWKYLEIFPHKYQSSSHVLLDLLLLLNFNIPDCRPGPTYTQTRIPNNNHPRFRLK